MIPRLSRVPASDVPKFLDWDEGLEPGWEAGRVWHVRADRAEEWTPSLRVALRSMGHYLLRWAGLR